MAATGGPYERSPPEALRKAATGGPAEGRHRRHYGRTGWHSQAQERHAKDASRYPSRRSVPAANTFSSFTGRERIFWSTPVRTRCSSISRFGSMP